MIVTAKHLHCLSVDRQGEAHELPRSPMTTFWAGIQPSLQQLEEVQGNPQGPVFLPPNCDRYQNL